MAEMFKEFYTFSRKLEPKGRAYGLILRYNK